MRSIKNNKEMVTALLADYKVQESGATAGEIHNRVFSKYKDVQQSKYVNPFESNQPKRYGHHFNNVEESFTCLSQVKYARPQLARSASGIRKYIINTGEHTQTLRLEKCTNPQSRCSFISENYRSSCVQVYSYHRLLTWNIKLGLHMDVFKVPTCCSCHVHGYAEIYPPYQKDPYSNSNETFPGVEFIIPDKKHDIDEVMKPSNYVNKYSPSSHFITSLGTHTEQLPSSFESENRFSHTKSNISVIDMSQNRSTNIVSRLGLNKSASISRPYDKVPLHHAPNTRAPGYTGTFTKSTHPNRPKRPFSRDSTFDMEDVDTENDTTFVKRHNRPASREASLAAKNQSERDEELHKTQRRINYNYHPIIDFFKPQASMLHGEV
ncbi:uncharacterized protein LOC117180315 isoform X2 [Belonocnema kinseyi]|uniref:uncharacterized protein LOC117180315 isoform X2 n=1 Tax=Belonocnema kinseyi TaxID=2817044 RepID=UPI00143CCD11|nr:uncharacterized protein LOC117180315 isoform X2 [Belonocnema kinseyi]